MTCQQIEDRVKSLSMITNQAEDDLPKTYDELFTQLEEKGILFEEFWAALVTAQKLASKVNDEGGGNHV